MWQRRTDERTLWMDITAGERDFVISLGGRDGPLAKESEVLDEVTVSNLRKTLNELTKERLAPPPEAFQNFGALLFEVTLPEVIQHRLLEHEGPLIFATQELTLPWELLCAEQNYLCLKHSLCRQLRSLNRMRAELFGRESPVLPRDEAPAALVIANPRGDLPAAAAEAEEICGIFRAQGLQVHALVGPRECTYQRIMADRVRARPYEIIHFCGHAVDLQEKETSAIPLADGGLLMAQDLQRTFKGEPLVFLNACWTAKDAAGGPGGRPGYKGANVVRTLAEAFTVGNRSGRVRAIIGSLWWTLDNVAQGLAGQFYRQVFKGETVGEALKLARNEVRATADGADPAVWTTYVLFGEPGLTWSGGPGSQGGTNTPQGSATPAMTASTVRVSHEETAGPTSPDPQPTESGQTPPSPAGGDPSSSATGPGLAEGLPWSNEVRIAFAGALSVMSTMRWHVFSTVQLVLGLTYLEQGLLAEALRQKGHEPNSARRALRELLSVERKSDASESNLTSPNVKKVLQAARRSAEAHGGSEVIEADLVLAMLQIEGAGAVLLLKTLDIDLDALRHRAQRLVRRAASEVSDITLPDGSLNREIWDAHLLSAMDEATWLAYRSFWPDLRSPHLFLGILNRPGSRLAAQVAAELRVDPNSLATALLVGLAQQQKPNASIRRPKLNREFLSENALNVLREAQSIARARGRTWITERDVVEAIVSDSSNLVATVLQTARIDPLRLLWSDPDTAAESP